MTVAELIAKLSKVDPTLLVCDDDWERGLGADVQVYERTAHVDRTGHEPRAYEVTTEPQERVVVITRWGQDDEGTIEL